MALLVGGRRGVRPDRVVAGIEVLDDALDRPALAAGVATFEDDEETGTDLAGPELTAEMEPQLEQPALGDFDTSFVLLRPSRCERSSWSSRFGEPTGCDATWMAERLRVGLVGGGPWAQRVHAPAIAAHPDFELAGVWTRRPAVADELAAAHGATAFADVEAMIDAVDVVASVGTAGGAARHRHRRCAGRPSCDSREADRRLRRRAERVGGGDRHCRCRQRRRAHVSLRPGDPPVARRHRRRRAVERRQRPLAVRCAARRRVRRVAVAAGARRPARHRSAPLRSPRRRPRDDHRGALGDVHRTGPVARGLCPRRRRGEHGLAVDAATDRPLGARVRRLRRVAGAWP